MALQVQTALGAVLRDAAAREQPCGVFGSFGWSGEAVDEMEGRLKVRHVACLYDIASPSLFYMHTHAA